GWGLGLMKQVVKLEMPISKSGKFQYSAYGKKLAMCNNRKRKSQGVVPVDVAVKGIVEVKPLRSKTSRGRVPVLPSKYNDSVVNSKICVDKKECALTLPSYKYHPYCQSVEDDGMDCLGFDDYGQNQSTSLRSSLTSINGWSSQPLVEAGEYMSKRISNVMAAGAMRKPIGDRRKSVYKPEDFALGDIVWAKSGKRYPAWPAIVIDPMVEAPEAVLSSCVPGALCVMYFGYSRKRAKQRDYAWVKGGMILPFLDYLDKFQRQTYLHKSQPSDFRMAIEEAYLTEQGFVDSNQVMNEAGSLNVYPMGFPEATGSNRFRGHQLQDQVCCDGCNVWIHAECAKISNQHLKLLEEAEYYCPACKPNLEYQLTYSDSTPKPKQSKPPDKITVVCNGMEATYFPSLHLVECNCGSCGTRKERLRPKNGISVQVKGPMMPLERWLSQFDVNEADPTKLNKSLLFAFLGENREPLYPKWTSERCAVCRWVEDWDDNKVIICNRLVFYFICNKIGVGIPNDLKLIRFSICEHVFFCSL
ncbi:Histone-lysine N-methyltransferase ATX3-like protein, partial [Drosera capensis]